MASRIPLIVSALCVSLFVAACGGGGGETTADTATTTTTTTTTDTTGTTTTSGVTTDVPGTTAEAPTTSSSTTGEDTTSTATTEPATGTTTTTETTGADIDCAAIPAGPFTPELLAGGFDGSEDLGFDGAGGLALKTGDQVVIVTADLNEVQLAAGLPQVYGTRFATGGDLLLALPQSGKLQAVAPNGTITDVAAGLQGPNGVYVDPSGGVWLTEFGGGRVVFFDAQFNKTTVHEGPAASTANGVVLDPDRGLLFFTNYGAGRLLKLAVDDQGQALGEPIEVAAIQGAALDGLALDACGHVYAVDQGKSRLYRANLDPDAVLVGAPELLAEFDSNVANAQFGRGGDWDPESLYLSGNPGDLYRVHVGVPGAPIGLP